MASIDTQAGMTTVKSSKAEESAKSTPKTAGKIDRMDVKVSDNGGFHVECYSKPKKGSFMGAASKSYTFASPEEFMTFIESNFEGKEKTPKDNTAEPTEPPAPSPAKGADAGAGDETPDGDADEGGPDDDEAEDGE